MMVKSMVGIVVGLLGLGALSSVRASCDVADNSLKQDCGYIGIQQGDCEAKGCCWQATSEPNVPYCFYSSSSNGYILSGMEETASGYTAKLTLAANSKKTLRDDQSTIAELSLDVIFETDDIVRVKITDASKARWEIPQSVIPREENLKPFRTQNSNRNFKVTFTESPFSFQVVRVSDGISLFNLDGSSFVFEDQFIALKNNFDPSAIHYGLGESARLEQALKADTTYTLWAADIPSAARDVNLYGAFPYYVQLLKGTASGAMLMNSNGMDITLEKDSMAFKTVGGIVDLYVFAGSTPAAVVDQYTQVVGRPMMMPYWSLGFHNCKYGYESVYQVEEVVANYSKAGIPLDTQWMDIDYMEAYRDFTWNTTAFAETEVKSFVNDLHANGQHFVPIIDPGIMIYKDYDAYETGLKEDLFIKDITGENYMAQVWPGPVYFPDFLHPKSVDYWTNQIESVHKGVPIDGLWIDMNEVSNFCNQDGTGQVCSNTAAGGCPNLQKGQTECCLDCRTVDSSNSLDFPPYTIHNKQQNGNLASKTVPMSATQYGNVSVYNTHNLYGLTEQIATNAALTSARKARPFILSRSSFLSTGVHSAKWSGDNAADWEDLKTSIVSIMDFNLFGIPMIGADICGFLDNTTEELCARWISVGAFYPFSRNHNTLGAAPQELYLWESVTKAAKYALGIRYQILPYLYTLFYDAHTSGATVARPLWANFPGDPDVVGIDSQFMLGDGILISPVVDEGVTAVEAYFSGGQIWYDFSSLSIVDAIDSRQYTGVIKSLATPIDRVNVHIRGYTILPLQEAAMTTTEGRKTPFTLVAALCPRGKAVGSLFWDDGEQVELKNSLKASYTAAYDPSTKTGFVSGIVDSNTLATTDKRPQISTIKVIGFDMEPPSLSPKINKRAVDFTWDATAKLLTFTDLDLPVDSAFDLTWSA